jgi:hypothetical protein
MNGAKGLIEKIMKSNKNFTDSSLTFLENLIKNKNIFFFPNPDSFRDSIDSIKNRIF